MVAARLMLEGRVGILRTMPVPPHDAVQRFRREARALGAEWPEGMPYGEFLRTLDKSDPAHLAVVRRPRPCSGAPATPPSTVSLPPAEQQVQAAIAAPYAHVTAPLRRLVDRFGLVVCEALSSGDEVPGWARSRWPACRR